MMSSRRAARTDVSQALSSVCVSLCESMEKTKKSSCFESLKNSKVHFETFRLVGRGLLELNI